MAATIVPTAAFMRRLIVPIAIEVLAVIGATLAVALTRNALWVIVVPIVTIAFLVWIVYLLRAHRDEWRFAMDRNGNG